MGRRTGGADLPLHGGRVPAWLATRMARLGRLITEAVVLEWGREEMLRRLSHPFWFQSFGAVMGMDWHSSGITTSVMGALKRGLEPVADELGLYVCGGRGKHSRKTPAELLAVGDRVGLDGDALGRASRLVAKVDSAALQDGFAIYLHSFVVSADGHWTVVQQGMNTAQKTARRYHWLSEGLESFVDAPHTAIEGPVGGTILNLADRRAIAARAAQIRLVRQGPDAVVGHLLRMKPPRPATLPLPHLSLPAHHEVRESDVVMRRLWGNLAAAADRGPADFQELLLTPGVGERTVAALAMVGEVVYGAPARFSDPARFSLAHGGKDGHPFPVPLKVYDQTITALRRAVEQAKLGRKERLGAMKRLDAQARLLEGASEGRPFAEIMAEEWRRSHEYGGRTVSGPAAPAPARSRPAKRSRRGGAAEGGQLALPGL